MDDSRERSHFVSSTFLHESPRWPLDGLLLQSHLPSQTRWLIRQIPLLSKPGLPAFHEQDIYVKRI